MDVSNIPEKIIIHHTASPRDTTTFEQIDEWHEDREFPLSKKGYNIGYHYVINGKGVVRQFREENEMGCHTLGQNTKSIGIALTGNFDDESPTIEQEKSLGELIQNILNKYKIDINNILPHRKFSNTHCPGTSLRDTFGTETLLIYQIEKLMEKVAELQKELKAIQN